MGFRGTVRPEPPSPWRSVLPNLVQGGLMSVIQAAIRNQVNKAESERQLSNRRRLEQDRQTARDREMEQARMAAEERRKRNLLAGRQEQTAKGMGWAPDEQARFRAGNYRAPQTRATESALGQILPKMTQAGIGAILPGGAPSLDVGTKDLPTSMDMAPGAAGPAAAGIAGAGTSHLLKAFRERQQTPEQDMREAAITQKGAPDWAKRRAQGGPGLTYEQRIGLIERREALHRYRKRLDAEIADARSRQDFREADRLLEKRKQLDSIMVEADIEPRPGPLEPVGYEGPTRDNPRGLGGGKPERKTARQITKAQANRLRRELGTKYNAYVKKYNIVVR